MNKFFKTLAASVLGLALAAGVGVGVAGGVKSTEVSAASGTYTCGFETSEGFTAGTTYNNETPRSDGPDGQKWSTVFGTVSTNQVITGSNSAQIRYYYNKDTLGYLVSDFALPGVKKVSYRAKANSSKGAKIKLDTFYSIDGTSWTIVDSGIEIASSATSYSFDVNGITTKNYYIKFAASSASVKPTSGNVYLVIDDISIQYEMSSDVPLTSISVEPINLFPGETTKAQVKYSPVTATNKNVSYEITTGTDIASVTDDGTIEALKSGTATLTVTPEDTSAGATAVDATITVNSYPSIEVVEVGKKYAIVSGGKYELSGIDSNSGSYSEYSGSPMFVRVYDVIEGAYDNTVAFQNGSKYLQYHGNDNKLYEEDTLDAMSSWTVATEDSRLVVRNVANRIRVLTCNKSTHKFNCYANLDQDPVDFVEYVPGIPLESFSFADTMEVKVGLSKSIEVTYVPANASDKTLTWESNNEGVATVSDGTVTGVSEGTAVITASKEGLESQSCTVTVTKLTTHEGTESDPYSVEDAVNVAKAGLTPSSAYVKGLVTKFISTSTYDKCSFWVGDSLEQVSAETGAFEFFQLTGITEESYKLIKVGATVVGCGDITLYQSKTAEFAKGGSLVYNSYAVANEFGKSFNDEISAICAVTKADAPGLASDNLVDFFDAQAVLFDLLDEVEQAHFSGEAKTGDKATDLENMLSTYDYCMSKYSNLNNFLSRDVVSGQYNFATSIINSSNNTMMIVIISVAVASISLLGVTIFLKKRRAVR